MTATTPLSGAPGPVDNRRSRKSLLRTLPYAGAAITGGFWAHHQQVNRAVSLRHGFAMLEQAGNLRNLRIAAGAEQGSFTGFVFADSDVYKWLEAVAWELGRSPDAELQQMAGQAIALVAAAQAPDGYLDTYYQIEAPDKRWTNFDHGHELYCAGHLVQAAVAFARVLGDERLLAIALRFVDHIEAMFGPGKHDETCGHPEIETALVELYRLTGDRRHLEMAQLFIDRRGRNRMGGHAGYGPIYQQDHAPVRDAVEVAGHAVRQLYLTTGVADLYMEQGEQALLDAMLRLWDDMALRKLYLTGGVGSRFDGEAFGAPYELPPDTCYCETCAAIASLMWNWRMLLLTGSAQYADLFERTLYNGVLASPGLDGSSYLYVNPLQVRDGRYVRASTDNAGGNLALRPAWHNCACCPPNVMRLFASLAHYLATQSEAGLQIHQYATAALAADLPAGRVALDVATDYPWDGRIRISVGATPATPWPLALRIPGWSQEHTLALNGQPLAATRIDHGYAVIERTWQPGDVLELSLAVQPRFVRPHPRVDAVRGCVAVERGPLVYCVESHDQPAAVDLLDVQADPGAALQTEPRTIAGAEVVAVLLQGRAAEETDDALYRPLAGPATTPVTAPAQPVALTAIPYYVWGNRGMKSMRVWIPEAGA